MLPFVPRWVSLLPLVGLAGAPAGAFDAQVVDRTSGRPIADAEVAVLGRTGSVRTDVQGRFSWAPDPHPPFEVLVVLPGGAHVKPILVTTLTGAPLRLEVSPALFEHPEEGALHKAVSGVSDRVGAAAASGRYGDAFREMAALQPLVSAFFEKVLVMAKDEKVRANRLALLKSLSNLLAGVADFSKVSAGSPK